MKKLIFTAILLMFGSQFIYSQQIPLFSQYYLNNFFYNPAKAGTENNSQAFLLLRKQWIDIPDAPESALFTFETPLKPKKVGLGITFYNDLLHIVGRTGVFGTYGYSINLANDQLLSFGISVGINQNKVFFDRIITDDIDELSWLNNLDTKAKIDGNFGLNYSKDHFEVGISCFQLFNNSFAYRSSTLGNEIDYKLIRHYFGSVKYSLISEKWDGFHIDPMILIRTAEGLPTQFEGNLTFNFKDKAWFGAMYRQNFGLSFLAGVTLYEKLTIGYAYDYSLGDITKYAGGTHEIVIGYKFLPKAVGSIQPIANIDQEKINKSLRAQNQQIEKLQEKDKNISKDLKTKDEQIKLLNEEIANLRKANKPNESEIQELVKKYVPDFIQIDTLKSKNQKNQVVIYQQDSSSSKKINDQLGNIKLEIEKLKQAKNLDETQIKEVVAKYIPQYTNTDTAKIGVNKQVTIIQPDNSKMQELNDQMKNLKTEIDKIKFAKNLTETEVSDLIRKYIPEYVKTADLSVGKNTTGKSNNNSTNNLEKNSKVQSNSNTSGYYVIVGCYKSQHTAEIGQNIIQKGLNIQTSILTKTINKDVVYYNLYTKQVNNFKEFKEECDKLNGLNINNYIQGNVWLLDGSK